MPTTGVPAPFTRETILHVAEGREINADALLALVVDHQALMARLPGVENLLYEWRKQFDATVLARSEEWYAVDAPAWAWEEFASSLEATPEALEALAAVHERTAGELAEDSPSELADRTPIVLVRET